jgi:cell division protein FtsB
VALALAVGLVAANAYVLIALCNGDRGLKQLDALQAKAAQLATVLATKQADLEQLERRVVGLRGPHYDLDLLDQQARARLGFAHPRDRLSVSP